MRKKKPDMLSPIVAEGVRFWTGLVLIPLFLIIQSPLIKLCFIVLFAISVNLAGKRVRYLYFIMMTASITFFHLLTPRGTILWEIGVFRITEGSLINGLSRGIGLAGLVFISLFSVTRTLKLPGKLGGLLGRTFFYFEVILDGKKRVMAKDFIGSLDRILLEIFPPDGGMAQPGEEREQSLAAHRGRRIGNVLYPLIWGLLGTGALILDRA